MGKQNLGAWLKKHMPGSSSSSSFKKKTVNMPPLLPSPRPRPLTPNSTCDDELSIRLESQPAKCFFFSKLPSDIRLMIIKKAFGDQKVHMDLTFDYSLVPPPDPMPRGHTPNHAAIYRQDDCNLSKVNNKPHGKKLWRWGGCVCHMNPPFCGVYKRPDMMRFVLYGLGVDSCMRGYNQEVGIFCDRHHGTKPDKCRIGAMGFLLSCRQAYVEGLEVLYVTNWIVITSQHLLLYFPQLVLPQRLASITKMELRVQGYNIDWADDKSPGPANFDLSHLGPMLRHVETCCTSLHSLFLFLNVDRHIDGPTFFNGPTMPTIDAFFLAMELTDMVVEMPQLLYEAAPKSRPGPPHPLEFRQEKNWEAGNSAESKEYRRSLWRCLESLDDEGGLAPRIEYRPVGNYPKPPLQLLTPENADKRVPSRGYWLRDGIVYDVIARSNCGIW